MTFNAPNALSVALHTAARHYCTEHEARWHKEYAKLQRGREHRVPYAYSSADLAVFPRYNVLRAILLEVLRIVPDELPLEGCRELLVLAGQVAETLFTSRFQEGVATRAMQEEREAFCAYVGSLDQSELWRVPPLPCCRVLDGRQKREIVDNLKTLWGVHQFWYPLIPTARRDVEAFLRAPFELANPNDRVQAVLRDWGVSRVLYLDEYDHASEIDLSLLDVSGGGEEEFWTTAAYDWLLYVSHESTVTVGGRLLDALQREWDGWLQARWSG